jgi:release factor glutamine methyltransferase
MLYQKLVNILFKPVIKQYIKFNTVFYYKKLKLKIFTGVFHPQFFFSSKYLATFVEGLDLNNKLFCEPCCGSGLISLIAFRKGADVYCFDINPKAVENIKYNFSLNNPKVNLNNRFHVYHSDGFHNIPKQLFDYIIINPPYFFKEPVEIDSYAWNCGKNGEFFMVFFDNLKMYLKPSGLCYMVLADNCEIERIKNLALSYSLCFKQIHEKKVAWEKNFIFEITLETK